MISTEACLAGVGIVVVGEAVWDIDQAEVSVDVESGNIIVASDAKTETVVLQTVAD